MAAELVANELTTCSNCELDEKQDLYLCVMDDCPKYGEVFCVDCGKMAHKTKNHPFDVNMDHIKQVNPDQLALLYNKMIVKHLSMHLLAADYHHNTIQYNTGWRTVGSASICR